MSELPRKDEQRRHNQTVETSKGTKTMKPRTKKSAPTKAMIDSEASLDPAGVRALGFERKNVKATTMVVDSVADGKKAKVKAKREVAHAFLHLRPTGSLRTRHALPPTTILELRAYGKFAGQELEDDDEPVVQLGLFSLNEQTGETTPLFVGRLFADDETEPSDDMRQFRKAFKVALKQRKRWLKAISKCGWNIDNDPDRRCLSWKAVAARMSDTVFDKKENDLGYLDVDLTSKKLFILKNKNKVVRKIEIDDLFEMPNGHLYWREHVKYGTKSKWLPGEKPLGLP